MKTKRNTIRTIMAVSLALLVAFLVLPVVDTVGAVALAGSDFGKGFPIELLVLAGGLGMVRNVARETIMGFTTAVGTTWTTVTPGTNQSLTIRFSGDNSPRPEILGGFATFQDGVPIVRVRAGSFPENQIGIYARPLAAAGARDFMSGIPRKVKGNDLLDWMHQGSTTAGNIDHSLLDIFYPVSPTTPSILITYAEYLQYVVGHVNAENTITTGTDGQWAAGERFDAEQNPFTESNGWYCIEGYDNTVACAAVSYQTATSGNVRIAGPGSTDARDTRSRFLDQARLYPDKPLIHVFNQSTLPSTIISACVDENGGDPIVNTFYGLLKNGFNPEALV